MSAFRLHPHAAKELEEIWGYKLAELHHVSVEKLVAALVGDGADDWFRLQARARRGSLERLHRVLSKVSDAAAEAYDQFCVP